MSDPLFSHVALIGLGQMGASLGLALKAGGRVRHISGYDLHPDHSATALSVEAIDQLSATAAEAVRNADLVIFCTPVGTYSQLMQSIAPHLKSGAIITDIGSIKQQTLREIVPHLPQGAVFIPSHPVAGTEKVGPYHAHAQFFAKRLFLICPDEQADEILVGRIGELWQSTGARVDVMPAALHDQIYAYISHLPQLMAFAAVGALDEAGIRHDSDDELFRRFIRIGRSDPEMWRDVFLQNSEHLLQGAEHVKAILVHMRHELAGGLDQHAGTEPDDATRLLLAKAIWPRLLASALIVSVTLMEQQIGIPMARYAAGGFLDFTCPMIESPEPDMAVVSQHPAYVLSLVDGYLRHHQAICSAIGGQARDALLSTLATAQASGKKLIATHH